MEHVKNSSDQVVSLLVCLRSKIAITSTTLKNRSQMTLPLRQHLRCCQHCALSPCGVSRRFHHRHQARLCHRCSLTPLASTCPLHPFPPTVGSSQSKIRDQIRVS